MRTLTLLFGSQKLMLTAGLAGALQAIVLPNPVLLVCLGMLLFLEICINLLQASRVVGKGAVRAALRGFIYDVSLYLIIVACVFVMTVLLHAATGLDCSRLTNWVIGAMSFVQLFKIFFTAHQFAPKSALSKWVLIPLIKATTGLLTRAAKQIETYEPDKIPPATDAGNGTDTGTAA